MTDLIIQAVRELAVRCDGAESQDGEGFNKPDSFFGKWLAAIPAEMWTDSMRADAMKMLGKYTAQLLKYGIDLTKVEAPQRDGYYERRLLTFEQGHFVFRFDYNYVVNGEVAKINGARFNSEVWRAPHLSAKHVGSVAESQRFLISPEARQAIDNPPEGSGNMRTLSFVNGRFEFRFPKSDRDLMNAIKVRVPSRGFDGKRVCWHAPHAAAEYVAVVAEEFDFHITDAAAMAIEEHPYPYEIIYEPNSRARLRLYALYNPEMIRNVKRIRGQRYVDDGRQKYRTLPLASSAYILEFLSLHPEVYVPPEIRSQLGGRTEEDEQRFKDSLATAADIDVPRLGGKLHGFQAAGVKYIAKNKRVLLADEMGLGKTVQVLAAAEYIESQGEMAYPMLVICPAFLKYNWLDEASRWLPHRRVGLLHGRNAQMPLAAEIVIMSYATVMPNLESLKQYGFKMLAVDEGHNLKNPKAKRTMAVTDLATDIDYIVDMTGTPLENRPKELVSQLRILRQLDAFGGFWGFVNRFCQAQRTTFGLDTSGAAHLGELNKRLREVCMIRRRKEEVLKDLPDKQRTKLFAPLSNEKEYRTAEANLIAYLRRISLTKAARAERAEALVRINTLRQLVAEGKMRTARQWISEFLESGEKLVVFAVHKRIVKTLAREFNAPYITGDVAIVDRQSMVNQFQTNPDCRIIVCNIKAAGVGLTMTAASNVLFVEQGWTPAAHDQAEDRLHRISQKSSVNCWYLLAQDTIDDYLFDIIQTKRGVVSVTTDGVADDGEYEEAEKQKTTDMLINKLIGKGAFETA